ncbi:hypothetical protein [Aureimonas ureilytica]|uniref:hypothetical protein n=1 Tax=Aureimonas ureilytica TaxID=401562 RepID=UPI0003AB2757|nr:hypothetical protein [Aureimonas ureilytica]
MEAVAAERERAAEILTVSGHLLEVTLSSTFQASLFNRWMELDQDPVSIAGTAAETGTARETFEGSVAGIHKAPTSAAPST